MKGFRVYTNSDKQFTQAFKARLKANHGYCPHQQEITQDAKCMCRTFRVLLEDDAFSGFCPCGYYFKELIE